MVLLAVLLGAASCAQAPLPPNMNGAYTVANAFPNPKAKGPHANGFSPSFRDYPSEPANPVRYFDVYSPPIRTQYSQVWWTMMRDVPLPAGLVEQFDRKAIAIVGYESDQVEVLPKGAPPGSNGTTETRVPITWAYNHHYGPILAGKDSVLKKVKLEGGDDPRDPKVGHANGDGTTWVVEPSCSHVAGLWHDVKFSDHPITVTQAGCNLTLTAPGIAWSPATGSVAGTDIRVEFGGAGTAALTGKLQYDQIDWSNAAEWDRGAPSPKSALPYAQTFYIGNGGEYRKSFHGMPPGYAQVLESPSVMHIQPMQIDTKNRDGSMDRPEQGFHPGLYPKTVLAPRTGPDAAYSGLLECPCTDRISKKYESTYATQHAGRCSTQTATADECYAAAATVGVGANATNRTGSSAALPPGCTTTVSGPRAAVFFNTKADSTVLCGGHGPLRLAGKQQSMVTVALELDVGQDTATITLSGPSAVWFGVGFGATTVSSMALPSLVLSLELYLRRCLSSPSVYPQMAALPYAIVVDGKGEVTERKLANHAGGGSPLSRSVRVASGGVLGGVRTVVLTRPLAGATAAHYSFDSNTTVSCKALPSCCASCCASTGILSKTVPFLVACLSQEIQFIDAVGKTAAYSYHRAKTASVVSLHAVGAPDCICNHPAPFGQTKGSIEYYGPTNYTTHPARATQVSHKALPFCCASTVFRFKTAPFLVLLHNTPVTGLLEELRRQCRAAAGRPAAP
eukprot:SAG22_NODE_326_length_12283_cov_248.386408_3_plen_736_part_00